jgi:hypothetical protein
MAGDGFALGVAADVGAAQLAKGDAGVGMKRRGRELMAGRIHPAPALLNLKRSVLKRPCRLARQLL